MPGIILSCVEIDRDGRVSLDGLSRTYRRTFRVITSSWTVGALQVKFANLGPENRLPLFGEFYAAGGITDLGAICTEKEANQPNVEDDPTIWEVTATYRSRSSNPSLQSGQPGGGGGGSQPQASNPLFEPPSIQWSTRQVERAVFFDQDAQPIANTAGSPFENVSRSVAIRTLDITRNELHFDPWISIRYVNTLNSAPFQGRPPDTVHCDDYFGSPAFKDNQAYHSVSYRFSFAPDNEPDFFKMVLINKGAYARKWSQQGTPDPNAVPDPNAKPERVTDDSGQVIAEAILAPSGIQWFGNVLDNPSYALTFDIHARSDFNDLSLPDPAWF